MDELVKLVSERTGLPAESARTAVDTVLGYVKSRLPEPIASQLEGMLEGSGASGMLKNLPGGLGGLLGQK